MTLLTYEIFETVVKEKSFQKASELLNITPSAVSHAIASMEKEVGFPLFVRGKQGTVLTAHGELLLPYVREVLNSEETLQQAVAEFQGLERGSVKIGAFNSVCSTWIPEIVRGFQAQYPKITVEIYQGTYDDVAHWLENGTINLGFLSRLSAEGLSFWPLYQDRLVCVVPKGFQTRNPEYITFEEMKSQQFVTQRESVDADIQYLMDKYGFDFHTNCHVVDDMSTVAMVTGGMGICILPELLMGSLDAMVDHYPMEEDQFREIGMAVNNPKVVSPAVKKMMEYIRIYTEGKKKGIRA